MNPNCPNCGELMHKSPHKGRLVFKDPIEERRFFFWCYCGFEGWYKPTPKGGYTLEM